MQELFGVVVVWSVLMTGVSFFCLIRLGRYRRQIRHMVEELSMMQQEDTDHRLSSCCRAGRMQEVILLLNQIVGRYRSERVLLRRRTVHTGRASRASHTISGLRSRAQKVICRCSQRAHCQIRLR